MELLKEAAALCNSQNISKESLISVYWIYTEPFSDTPIGICMKYKNPKTRIIISLTNGWLRDYPFENHVDIVYAVRKLRKQNFSVNSIANILCISHDLICRIIVGVDRKGANNENHKVTEEDE